MLERLKQILGKTDVSDALLLQLLNGAIADAIAFTHNKNCLECIDSTILEMAVYKYNRLGTEGLASESYNSTSYSYLEDYPESIKSTLKSYRKVRTL